MDLKTSRFTINITARFIKLTFSLRVSELLDVLRNDLMHHNCLKVISAICICAVCISWGPEEEVGAPLCCPALGSACGG